MVSLVRICFVLMQWSVAALGEDGENITISTLNETIINGTFSILNATGVADFQNSSILRYGHHRTYDCQDFQKAYVCIMMCLERGFHIARADKKCSCFCYKNKVKAKYFDKVHEWKIPTTSKPAWAAGPSSTTLQLDLNKLKIIGGEIVHLDSDESPEISSDAITSDGNDTHWNDESTVDPDHGGDEDDEEDEADGDADDGDAHDEEAENEDVHDEDADDGDEHEEEAEDEDEHEEDAQDENANDPEKAPDDE